MRRLWRWIFHALTTLSLLLCVGCLGESVRSFFAADGIGLNDNDRAGTVVMAADHGGLSFVRIREPLGLTHWRGPFRRIRMGTRAPRTYFPPGPYTHRFAGFGWGHLQAGGLRIWCGTVPLPVVGAIFGVLPTGRLIAIRRARHKRRAGHCASCSYDLTGNVSGVCPECGVKIAKG
jgi:hypothetical protein